MKFRRDPDPGRAIELACGFDLVRRAALDARYSREAALGAISVAFDDQGEIVPTRGVTRNT